VGFREQERAVDKTQSYQCFGGNNTSGDIDVATAVNAKGGAGRMDFESETFVCTGQGRYDESDIAATLRKGDDNGGGQAREDSALIAIASTERTRADGRNLETQEDVAYALCNPGSGGRTHSRQILTPRMAVRRLTPRECERLQGFPDDFTAVEHRGKPAADGPRYKASGNAMAVNVVRWIGRRIMAAENSATLGPNRARKISDNQAGNAADDNLTLINYKGAPHLLSVCPDSC
jgi:DNA (cytosine-5)-methyltransferase 1